MNVIQNVPSLHTFQNVLVSVIVKADSLVCGIIEKHCGDGNTFV
jgi:hypothetical protein